MAWMTLFIAGVLEIGWAIGLKYTDGFRRLSPTAATAIAMSPAWCSWELPCGRCPSVRPTR